MTTKSYTLAYAWVFTNISALIFHGLYHVVTLNMEMVRISIYSQICLISESQLKNSRRQKGDVKQVPYLASTNIMRCRKKFSRFEELAQGVSAPL
jgi:hypothetical protein